VSEQGAPLDPELLFTTLARHQVEFVLIGALAARMQGFPRFTRDADITPARETANLVRLAAALRELDARIYTEQIPEGLVFDCSPQMLARADIWNLITNADAWTLRSSPRGRLDSLIWRLTPCGSRCMVTRFSPRDWKTSFVRKKRRTGRRIGRMWRLCARC